MKLRFMVSFKCLFQGREGMMILNTENVYGNRIHINISVLLGDALKKMIHFLFHLGL